MDRLVLTGVLIIVIAALWMSGNEGRIKPALEEAKSRADSAVAVAEALGIKVNQLRIDHDELVKRAKVAEDLVKANNESVVRAAKLLEIVDHKTDKAIHAMDFLEKKLLVELSKPRSVIVSQSQPWLFRRSDLPLKKKLSESEPGYYPPPPLPHDPVHQKIIANVKSKLAESQSAMDEVSK